MKRNAGRMALVAAAAAGTAVLVGLAFFRLGWSGGILHVTPRFDLQQWLVRLPSNLPWVLPFMAVTATLSALRALVWGRTLPVDRLPPWRTRFRALALGGFVQNGLPGSLGVLASAWVLARHGGPPLPGSLASLLLAKLLEFGALVTLTALVALLGGIQSPSGLDMRPMLWTGLAALILFVVVLASARRLAPPAAARLERGGHWPRLATALRAIAHGLVAVGSPRRLVLGWALALLPVLASAVAYAIALRHVGGRPFLLGGALLLGAVTLAQMTPGLPSNLGIYYFVCTAVARAFGVADEPAATLAALTHLGGTFTHIVVGLAVAAANHDSLREVVKSLRTRSASLQGWAGRNL